MYLACKLSKFELNDWQGRMPNHLRWWDMFVQGMNMDLLEGRFFLLILLLLLRLDECTAILKTRISIICFLKGT